MSGVRYDKSACGRCAIVVAFLLAGLMVAGAPARADYNKAKRHFDGLSTNDQISMTLSLIATGDFNGLIDFGFTKRYYNAVLAFERREHLRADGILEPYEMAQLSNAASSFYGSLGFEYVKHPAASSLLLVPKAAFDTTKQTDHGFAFERNDKNLSLSFVAYDHREKSLTELYETFSTEATRRKIAYKRLRSSYFVVNGWFKNRSFYTWMSAIPGGSTGFTLSWSDQWDTVGSRIAILLANSFVPIPRDGAPPVSPPQTTPIQPREGVREPPPEASNTFSTGSGFQVTSLGHILTNFHVAGRCKSITVNKIGDLSVHAELVAGDSVNDLALLKATAPITGTVAAFRSGPPPRAGTDIAVFGFPLASKLASSGNIVTGNITSVAGINNDSRLFQISAPIQPGNSGGPVIDREGRVVAVVVSKLDELKEAAATGSLPQNVNFAIKGNVAMNFLDGAGVNYQRRDFGPSLDTPTIADLAQGFTFLIECRN